MTEQKLLKDCLCRLNQSHIDYMLVGSMAGNYWCAGSAGIGNRPMV
ncbi:hypothetical protein [Rhodopirellula bahusiensis]